MIELWWMPGTFVSKALLQEINEKFLRTISQNNYVQYKNSNNKQ